MPASNTAATGRYATDPWSMPLAGWKQVAVRTWNETSKDNIALISAGVGFYGFLALVPMLGAIVLSYGLLASPDTVMEQMRRMTAVMPADAAKLVGDQLLGIVESSHGKKGFGLIAALAVALYGAMNGSGAIVTALNIAYEQPETRGFVRLKLLALAITVGGLVLAVAAVTAVAALGHIERLIPWASDIAVAVGKLISYALMAVLGVAAAATLYRYGPDRRDARWTWLTPGSALAAALWLAITLGFGVYVSHFGSYNATYGSLAAVVVLLTWMFLSSYALLVGAELNSELERQTAADTTSGAPKPLGMRDAVVADMVAGDPPASDDVPPPSVSPPETVPDEAEQEARKAGRRLRATRKVLGNAMPSQRQTTAAKVGVAAAVGALFWWRRRRRLGGRS